MSVGVVRKFPKSGQAYQGDIAILRIDKPPADAKEVAAIDGRLIVAHSETGHHHFADAANARLLQGEDPNVCYLVAEGAYADLQHDRQVNPHIAYRLPKGCYEIRRQMEWTPEGWRQIQD